MFYKRNYGASGQWCRSADQGDDEFQEMDDSLFEEGEDGGIYLKSFLADPDQDYIDRIKSMKKWNEINTLKSYLSDTDYIISKLNELKLEDDEEEYEKTKSEYAEVLAKRKEARKRINELEAQKAK